MPPEAFIQIAESPFTKLSFICFPSGNGRDLFGQLLATGSLFNLKPNSDAADAAGVERNCHLVCRSLSESQLRNMTRGVIVYVVSIESIYSK